MTKELVKSKTSQYATVVCVMLKSLISLSVSHRINALDMPTAVSYLESSDSELQVLGAAYIQHECYHNNDSKKLVRSVDCKVKWKN